jgi:hypothetical protein
LNLAYGKKEINHRRYVSGISHNTFTQTKNRRQKPKKEVKKGKKRGKRWAGGKTSIFYLKFCLLAFSVYIHCFTDLGGNRGKRGNILPIRASFLPPRINNRLG